MGISDILGKLIGKGPDESTGTALAGNVFTPGVESLLSAVPALVGAYEQGRGKPLGNVLSTLGNFGLTNAANRQKQQQDEGDVSARIESLASRGLAPQPGTLDAINQMTPEAADKELSDVEASQVKQQEHQQSIQEAQQKWSAEHRKPFPLTPGGTEAYTYDAGGNVIRAPQFDSALKKDNVNTPFKLFQQAQATGDYSGWNAWQASQAGQAVGIADAKLGGRLKMALNFKMNNTPWTMVPELKTVVPFDKNTLRPVNPKTPGQIFGDPNWDDKYVMLDKKSATDTVPQLLAGRRALISLAQASAQVLPVGTGAPVSDFARTLVNKYKTQGLAVAGNVNAANFTSQRIKLALEIQKALTTSSRPVNLVEFNRITGEATGLSAEGESVIPGLRDTQQTARAKLNTLQDDYDARLGEFNLASPASGYWAKTLKESVDSAMAAPEPPTVITNPSSDAPATTPDDDGSALRVLRHTNG